MTLALLLASIVATSPELITGGPLPATFGAHVAVQEENDLFGLIQLSDDDYTQGLHVDGAWRPPAALRLFHGAGALELWGLHAGQELYTPRWLTETHLALLRVDRPYAGYLFVGATYDVASTAPPFFLGSPAERARAGSTLSAALDLGLTGPAAGGGPVQRGVHAAIRRAVGRESAAFPPVGWSLYQTRNFVSAELSMLAQTDLARIGTSLGGFSQRHGSGLSLSLSPRARLQLGGLLDNVGAGLELRGGLTEGYAVPSAPPSLVVRAYLFGGADGRFVAYDGLITGPLMNGATTAAQEATTFGELTFGAVLRFGAFELIFSQVWTTHELRVVAPGDHRFHNYGQIRLSAVGL